MKKFLFVCATAVCGLFTSAASAQDYCCPTQYDECCFNETGFEGLYIGANLGAFTNTAHRNDLDGFLTDNSGWTTINTNVEVGLQLGYDWMWNSSLFGLVADWSWVNTRATIHDNANAGSLNRIHNRGNWFTTIRARAGITFCDALLYITGGAAVTKFDNEWFDGVDRFRHNHTRWGWVGGFGAEYLVWCNWSFGAEFLFLQFDTHNRTFTTAAGVPFAFGHSDSAWVGRFTLNYRFGDLCSCFF